MKFQRFNRVKHGSKKTRSARPSDKRLTRPLLEHLEDRRMLAIVAWTGGGDGTLWRDASNWSTGSVPTLADDVTIDVATDALIQIDGSRAEANSLLSTERIDLRTTLRVTNKTIVTDLNVNRGRLETEQLNVFGNVNFQISSFVVSIGTFEDSANVDFIGSANSLTGSFVNHGSLAITDGNVRQSNASITNSEIGSITFEDSTLSSGEFINHGKFMSRGTTWVTGTFEDHGKTEIADGQLAIRHGSSDSGFDVPSGATLQLGGNFTFGDAAAVVGAGAVTIVSGRQEFGKAKFSVSGPVSVSGNALANFATDVAFASLAIDRGSITSLGSVTLRGDSSLVIANVNAGGSFTIQDGLTVRNGKILATNGVAIEPDASVEIVNFESTVGPNITNQGELTVRDSVLKFTSMELQDGGALNGTGRLTGDVTNTAGIVSPGFTAERGRLAIQGEYVQGSEGELAIDLFGTGGQDNDELSVSESASIDGTIDVAVRNGFTPADEASFPVIQAGSFRLDAPETTSSAHGFVFQSIVAGESLLVVASLFSVAADEVVVNIGDLIRITGSDVAYVTNPDPGQPIGTINQVEIEVFHFGGWLSEPVTASDIKIYEDRIEFNEVTSPLTGELEIGGTDVATLENLQVTILGLTVSTSNPLGGEPITLGESTSLDGIRITAEKANYIGDVAELTDVTASIERNANESLAINLEAAEFTANLSDAIFLTSTDVRIAVADDSATDLLTVSEVSVRIPALTGEDDSLTISGGLAVNRTGKVRFLSDVAEFTYNVAAANERFSIADVLPVAVDAVTLRFTDAQNDLSQVELSSALRLTDRFVDSLPFTPVLMVGDPDDPETTNGEFDVTISLSGLTGDGPILKDVDPITLGFEDWDLGEVVFDGQITLGGLDSNGDLIPVSEENDITGFAEYDFGHPGSNVQASDPTNSYRLDLGGSYTPKTEERGSKFKLDVETTLGLELKLGEIIKLRDVAHNSSLVIEYETPDTSIPKVEFSLNEVGISEFEMNFGNMMTIFAGETTLNLSVTDDNPLIVHFDELGLRFPILGDNPSEEPALEGTVTNLDIFRGGGFEIGGATIEGTLLDNVADFLPIEISEVGFEFGDDFFIDSDDGRQIIGDATNVFFSISGEIGEGENALSLPLYGDVSGLIVDVQRLLDGEFPIADFKSFTVGVKPIELTPDFSLGGEISLGLVDVTEGDTTRKSLYGTLLGEFDTPMFGGAASVTFSEIGPLFGELRVPLAVPLGPSGLILTDVEGGFRFAQETIPSVTHPAELIETNEFVDFLNPGSTPEIGEALQTFINDGIESTWELPFSMAVSGTVDSALTPGVFQGDLSLGTSFGSREELKLLGTGEIDVYGMPFGRAGVLLDFAGFTDPNSDTFLAPKLDFAFTAPAPGNPLGFLLPAEVVFDGTLRTDGMIEAPLVAVRQFVTVALTELRDGVSTSEFALVTAVLDAMSAELNPNSPLARRLFPDQVEAAINENRGFSVSGEMLGQAIIEQLPTSFFDELDDLPELVELSTLVLRDALRAIDSVDVLFSDATDNLTAFLSILREAVSNAGTAAFTTFNPTLEINGALQPTFFGFPLGTPTDEVALSVSKNGIAAGLTTSIKESLKRSAGLFGTGLAAGFTELLVGGPGFTDELQFDFSLDWSDLSDVAESVFATDDEGKPFLNSFVGTINPFDDWEVSVSGAVKLLGLDILEVSGIVFAPQDETSTASLFATSVRNVGLDDNEPLTEENTGTPDDRIPVFRSSNYDAMAALGGILLTGELNMPAILQDPLAVFEEIASAQLPDISEQLETLDDGEINLEDLNGVTEIKEAYLVYVDQVVDALMKNSRAGAIQLYVPSPATLLSEEVLAGDDGSFNPDLIADFSEQLVEIMTSAYFEGFADLKVLSMDVGGAEITGGLEGLRARFDLLGLLNAELTMGSSTINAPEFVASVMSNPLVANVFDSMTLPPEIQLAPATIAQFVAQLSGDEIPVPTAYLSANLDSILRIDGIPSVTTDAEGNIEVRVGSADGTDAATLELFPTEVGLRPYGVDAAGQFVLSVSDEHLQLEVDADAQMIVLNTPVATGRATGVLNVGEQVTAALEGEIGVVPFPSVESRVELDEFGCFSFDSDIIPLTPFEVGNCGPSLSVVDEVSSVDSQLTLQLNEPAPKDLISQVRVSDGTSATLIDIEIAVSQRSGSIVLPEPFRSEITAGEIDELDVSILSTRYDTQGVDFFRPATPSFSTLAETVQVVSPKIEILVTTSVSESAVPVGDDLEERVSEAAQPIVVTLSAIAHPPVETGTTVTLKLTEAFNSVATIGEDYEVNTDSIEVQIGRLFSKSFTITPLDDTMFEPHERLSLAWSVDETASPNFTSVPRRIEITFEDNDPELPANALAFYSFDQTQFEIETREGVKLVEACCRPDLVPTYVDDSVTASIFESAKTIRTVFDGKPGPPIRSQGPSDLTPQGLEKHDPKFSPFSHAAVEETWTDNVDDTGYFEFSITPDARSTVSVSGIEFWERRVLENMPSELLVDGPEGGFLNGPTQWQVRSSLDDFETVMAEGISRSHRFTHHVSSFAEPFTLARGQDVAFRIYGIEQRRDDIHDIPWTVDNVALIGSTREIPVSTRLVEIDRAVEAITGQSIDLGFDFDNDGRVSEKDFDVLIDEILQVKRGDANLDGKVDFADFLVLSSNFGKGSGWADGSFDLNLGVDFGDFLLLSSSFGTGSL